MIYWICPKPSAPSGGVWFLYRLAGLLGERAAIVQTEPHAGPTWDYLPRTANVISDNGRVIVSDSDTVVVPEVLWQSPQYRPPIGRRIVFIQNYIWASKNPADYEGAQIVTCSRFLDNWCRRVLGIKPIGILSPYLDDGPWRVTPKQRDRTLIYARRNPELAKIVAGMLQNDGFPIDYVSDPITQAQIMDEHLADAEFYVHTLAPEGWPMACAEAMRAGTIVCGTTGGGGLEFMYDCETAVVVQDPELGGYATASDPTEGYDTFARLILEQMRILRSDADMRSRIWQQAHAWIGKRFSRQRTIAQLTEIFP